MILAVEHEKWGLWLNRASTLLNDAAKEKHLSSTLLNLLNERDDLHCEILKRHREYVVFSSTLPFRELTSLCHFTEIAFKTLVKTDHNISYHKRITI